MSIRLFTGLPGAGKSLSLVDALRRMHEREPGRPVYAYGVDGLREDLALPCQPRQWQDLPDGSIVVVDEAQKVWPSRRAGEPPADVRAFSEHRHRGFDFLIATQNPAYIDTYLRGLVEEHTHVVRRWGGHTVNRYVWQELCEDVKSQSMRARAQRQRWRYPKECFDMYKSSTLHTVKRRWPWQMWLLVAVAVVALPLGLYAWHRVKHVGDIGRPSSAAAPGGSQSSARAVVKYATPAAYAKAFIPRVASQPWSAPAYDGDAIRVHPDLLCIEFEQGHSGKMRCTCYTEQITPYRIGSLELCRTIARRGQYNPHRAPFAPVFSRRTKDDPVSSSGSAEPAKSP